MTTQFQIQHDFPDISLEIFEKYLNHPTLNEMLSEMPSFRSRELKEKQKLENDEIVWKFRVVAGGDIPGAVKRVVSETMFTWWETSRFVPTEHCIYWNISPLVANGKFSGNGCWKLRTLGKGTHRTIEGAIDVKIPFVGKLVENFIVNELKRNYEVEPDIQRKFYSKMKS